MASGHNVARWRHYQQQIERRADQPLERCRRRGDRLDIETRQRFPCAGDRVAVCIGDEHVPENIAGDVHSGSLAV